MGKVMLDGRAVTTTAQPVTALLFSSVMSQ